AEQARGGERAGRGGAGEHVEDRHLAEPVAGPEHGDARLVAALGAAQHLHLALEDEVHLAAALALLEDRDVGAELAHRQAGDEGLARLRTRAAEEADLAETAEGFFVALHPRTSSRGYTRRPRWRSTLG